LAARLVLADQAAIPWANERTPYLLSPPHPRLGAEPALGVSEPVHLDDGLNAVEFALKMTRKM